MAGNLPAIDSKTEINTFLFSSKEALNIVKQYCRSIAREQCSTSHFKGVNGLELDGFFKILFNVLATLIPNHIAWKGSLAVLKFSKFVPMLLMCKISTPKYTRSTQYSTLLHLTCSTLVLVCANFTITLSSWFSN